jgi:hypothetical protein
VPTQPSLFELAADAENTAHLRSLLHPLRRAGS